MPSARRRRGARGGEAPASRPPSPPQGQEKALEAALVKVKAREERAARAEVEEMLRDLEGPEQEDEPMPQAEPQEPP